MERLLSNEVKEIFQILQENGHQVYLVGGIVRDYFLNRENYDFDMATSATPTEMISLLKHFDLDAIDSRFGTIRIKVAGKNDIEITTFRMEEYEDETRYPTKIDFVNDILIDLKRRDFTMNALAWNHKGLIDCFHGLEDIRQSCIKIIGVPTKRFLEDPLRMLRAIRFSAQLDFRIDEDSYQAIVENAYLISRLSMESMRNEFVKILISNNPNYAIKCLFDSNIVEYIFFDSDIEWDRIYLQIRENNCKILFLLQRLSRLPCQLEVRLSAFLYHLFSCSLESKKEVAGKLISIEQLSEKLLKRLKFSKRIISRVCNIIKYYPIEEYISAQTNINRLICAAGEDCWKNIMDIRIQYFSYLGVQDGCYEILDRIRKRMKENSIIHKKQLCVTGNDMISLGYKGKEIGKIIDVLYDAVIEGNLKNTRVSLMKRAADMMSSIKADFTEE